MQIGNSFTNRTRPESHAEGQHTAVDFPDSKHGSQRMGCQVFSWFCMLAAGTLAACGSVPDKRTPVAAPDGIPVYVVAHGWHSGFALPSQAISPAMLPERLDFPEADYLEFGWGDRDFYGASTFSFWLMIKAGVWSEESTLLIEPLANPPPQRYPCSTLIALRMPRPNFRLLIAYIRDSLRRSEPSLKSEPLPSLYPQRGRFYPAEGRFHAFNTCNSWTWRGLAAAGYPVSGPRPLTADGLVDRIVPFGRPVPRSPSCPAD
jgi:uncharacterized protein (TIGR02117 family)